MKFNLTKENWIPCITSNGRQESYSFSGALIHAHEIQEIVGENPPITIALHRLLLAVLHRIYRGPKDAEAWNEMYSRGSFDAEKINQYFDSLPDRFDLFHEKYPFYQTASARENLQSGAAIQLYFQGKNNATLFEHTSTSKPKDLSPAEAARLVVAFQGFDFGGLKADGATQMAPLLQTAVALIRGNSLFETLMLNLHRYDGEDQRPFAFDPEKDIPAWERDDETHNAQRWPAGPVDLYTWQPRKLAIEAVDNGDGNFVVKNAVIMCGYTFPTDAEIQAKETMMAYRTANDGRIFSVGFSENRALWRNSRSLFDSQSSDSSRPRSLEWANELKRKRFIGKKKLPVDFYGIAADKAKLLFWSHERFDMPVELLEEQELIKDLAICLEFAEEIGSAVRVGANAFIKALSEKAENKRDALFLESNYWSTMETRFHMLLNRLPSDMETEMKAWFADTLQTASKAFRDTVNCLSGTAAEIQAAIKAENMLWSSIYKAIRTNAQTWQPYLPQKFEAKGGK